MNDHNGRYNTPEWKELVDVQNELSLHIPVDVLTITDFMKTQDELIQHLAACKRKLDNIVNNKRLSGLKTHKVT